MLFPKRTGYLWNKRSYQEHHQARPHGHEIIADSATGITLQVLINLLDLSVDTAFKRMLLIAKSMHRDTLLSLRENNVELAEEIIKSDDEVDRFSFYIVQQLKIAIKNEYLLKEIGLEEPRNCWDTG